MKQFIQKKQIIRKSKILKIISGILLTISIFVVAWFWLSSVWFWIGFECLAAILVAIGCIGELYLFHHTSGRKTREQDEHHRSESRFIMAVAVGVTMELLALTHAIPEALKLEGEVVNVGMTNALLWQTNLVLQTNVNETKIELLNALARLVEVKNAIPPRQISEKSRELFISELISSNNVSPKFPIKVFVGDTNQEADNFATFIRNMLNDAGYGTNGEQIIRLKGFKIAPTVYVPGFRTPSICVIYATDSNGKMIPMTTPAFGSIGIMTPTPIAIPGEIGNKNVPTITRYTTNPNDIIYGISSILGYIGYQPAPLNAPGYLRPGEVAFFVPPQGE